jgi:hypothetical protein
VSETMTGTVTVSLTYDSKVAEYTSTVSTTEIVVAGS